MRKKRFWIVLILIFIGLFLFYPVILEGLARVLIVEDRLAPADAIIVLSGDPNGERVNEAVKLYAAGYAKKMILTGGPLAWRLTGAAWMKKQALTAGVPAAALILEDKSRSTRENAVFTLPLVKQSGFKSVILVTSPLHTWRTKKTFQKVYQKEGVAVFACPVKQSEFKFEKWWQRHEDTQLVVWEYVSIVFYLLKRY